MPSSPFYFQTVQSGGGLQLQLWLIAGTAADASDLTLTFNPSLASFNGFAAPSGWLSSFSTTAGSVSVSMFDGGLGSSQVGTSSDGLLGTFSFTLASGTTSFGVTLTAASDLYDLNANAIPATPPATFVVAPTTTVSGALVSAAAGLQANASVSAFSVADTAANVTAGLASLAADTKLTGIGLTDGGTPALSLTAAQYAADTAILGKIGTPFTVSVSGATVAGAAALAANAQVSAFAVSDTAAAVAGALDALSGDTKLTSIALTVGLALSVTYMQLTNDTAALGKLPSGYTLTVSGVSVATAASVQANTHVTAFSVTDSAANVTAGLSSLAADSKLTGIGLTDGGTPALSLTAAQYAADMAILGKIGTPFTVAVSGATAAGAVALAANAQVSAFTVSDTASAVVSALDVLSGDTKLTSIALTGGSALSVTYTQLTNDTTALGKLTSGYTLTVSGVSAANAASVQANTHVTAFSVSDSAATVTSGLGALAGYSKLSTIGLTDSGTPVLSLTAAQFAADTAILGKIGTPFSVAVGGTTVAGAAALTANAQVSAFTVSDTAAAVAGALDTLSGYAKLTAIALTDASPVLAIGYNQLSTYSAALSRLTGTYTLTVGGVSAANASLVQANALVSGFGVSDNAAAISAALDTLQASSKLTSIALTDSNPISVAYAQLTSDAGALALLPSGYTLAVGGVPASAAPAVQANAHVVAFTVSDTAAAVAGVLDTLNAAGKLTSIGLTTGAPLPVSYAQLTGDTAAFGKLPGAYTLAVSGASAANASLLQANSHVTSFSVSDSAADVLAALDAWSGYSKLAAIGLTDSGTPSLAVSYTQYIADASALGAISGSYSLTVANVTSSAASGLQADSRVTAFSVTGVSATGAASIQADSKVSSFAVTDSASAVAAALDALNGDGKLASIALTDGGTPVLSLTYTQYVADTTALGAITGSYTLSISGAPASTAATLQGDTRVTAFAVSDSAANVASALDTLAGASKVSSIAVTGTGTQNLTVTFAQYSNDGTALARIGQSYTLTVTGAPVWAAPLLQNDQRIASFTVSDTSSDIAGALGSLNQDTLLTSIAATDVGKLHISYPLLTADTAALGKIGTGNGLIVSNVPAIAAAAEQANASVSGFTSIGAAAVNAATFQGYSKLTSFTVSDTWANISANLAALLGAPNLSTVNFITSSTASGPAAAAAVSATEALTAYAGNPAIAAVPVFDSSDNIVANLDGLEAMAGSIASVTLTDTVTPNLAITGAQYTADATVLATIASAYGLIVSAASAASAAALQADGSVSAFAVADTASNVTAVLSAIKVAAKLTSLSVTGSSGPDSLDLTGVSASATIALGGDTASASSGLSAPSLTFIGTSDAIVLGSGAVTIDFALQPASGIETIAGFQFGLDHLDINMEGAPVSFLRAADTTVGGVHAIAIYNAASPSYGVVLTGMTGGQTAASLLGSHLSVGNGQAIIT